jgi:hypothetical protein
MCEVLVGLVPLKWQSRREAVTRSRGTFGSTGLSMVGLLEVRAGCRGLLCYADGSSAGADGLFCFEEEDGGSGARDDLS